MFAIRPETYLAVSVLDVGTILAECSTVPRISVRIYQVPGVQYVRVWSVLAADLQ